MTIEAWLGFATPAWLLVLHALIVEGLARHFSRLKRLVAYV